MLLAIAPLIAARLPYDAARWERRLVRALDRAQARTERRRRLRRSRDRSPDREMVFWGAFYAIIAFVSGATGIGVYLVEPARAGYNLCVPLLVLAALTAAAALFCLLVAAAADPDD